MKAEEKHVAALNALGQLTRLRIFFHLVWAREELSAGQIEAVVDVPAPTLSHHLAVLRLAGLLRSRKEERFVYYRVEPRMVGELCRLLTACC